MRSVHPVWRGYAAPAKTATGSVMAKVYVVTCGEYSAYQIVGIFSTLDKAEQYTQKARQAVEFRFSKINETEEFQLDDKELESRVLAKYFTSEIGIMSGEIERRQSDLDLRLQGQRSDYTPIGDTFVFPDGITIGSRLCCSSYISQAHADKLCIEARQACLREVGGVANLRAGCDELRLEIRDRAAAKNREMPVMGPADGQ